MKISNTSSMADASFAPPPLYGTHRGSDLLRIANRFLPGLVRTESSSRAESTGPASRLVNFADLIDVVVVGNPTEQQLGRLENCFRKINSILDGAAALRLLRHATERHGRYPIVVFNAGNNKRLVTLELHRTARADERVGPRAPVGAETANRGEEEIGLLALIQSVDAYLGDSQRGRLAAAGFRPRRTAHAPPRAAADDRPGTSGR